VCSSAWVAAVVPPSRIGEIVVNHNARIAGESKYGISRTFRVILDLLSVYFFMRYRARPGHFFCSIGLALGSVSSLLLVYFGFFMFALGVDIVSCPLFLIAIVCLIASMQFLTTGVLSELISRTYFESSKRENYVIYLRDDAIPVDDDDWSNPSDITSASSDNDTPMSDNDASIDEPDNRVS